MVIKKKTETKNVQFKLHPEEWQFLTHLAAANNTSISDIFRAYTAYLMEGNPLVGMEQDKMIEWDAKTGEIRIRVRDEDGDVNEVE